MTVLKDEGDWLQKRENNIFTQNRVKQHFHSENLLEQNQKHPI